MKPATLLFGCSIPLLIISQVSCANILFLNGMPSKSHHIWNRPLMVALANQGHNVTALSVDVDKDVTPNLHYIQIEGIYEHMAEFLANTDMTSFADNNPYHSILMVYDYYRWVCDLLLRTGGAQQLKNYPSDFKFDVVIHDFTCGQCLLGFVHKFNSPPLISISAFNIPSYTPFVSGNPQFPAYVPLMPLAYPSEMTFIQRATNLFWHGVDRFYRHYMYMPPVHKISAEFFGPDMPDLTTIEQSTSLTFINTHSSIDIPQPLLPNVIEVGGIHIQKPNITKKLGKILDVLNGEKDVVLFSLGSNMRSDIMVPERIQMFLDAFAKLPEYNFLWKYESDNLKSIPKNVLIQKWMPQNDILSSPKVKLFMTHGGMLSTQEAVYHGVPMLGMPFFVDQHQNLYKSISAGVAEKIDYNNLSVDVIVDKIRRIITTPSYGINAKKRQAAFVNRQNTPLETALFWVNHVIENKEVPHFRTVLPQMPLWKLLMLDVVIAFIGFVFVVLLVIRKVIKGLCSSKSTKIDAKKKNK